MRQSFKTWLLTLAAGVTLIAAVPAHADSYNHRDSGKNTHFNSDRYERHNNRYERNDRDDRYNKQSRDVHYNRPDVIAIHNNDRVMIRDYYSGRHFAPGHAKRYLVGAPLPYGVRYHSVPRPLLVQLRPVPKGYQYVRVDDDVLLMSLASREILDAVTLLTVAGR